MPTVFRAILLLFDFVDASFPFEGILFVVYFQSIRPSMVRADIGKSVCMRELTKSAVTMTITPLNALLFRMSCFLLGRDAGEPPRRGLLADF